jgi:hypothetical protein
MGADDCIDFSGAELDTHSPVQRRWPITSHADESATRRPQLFIDPDSPIRYGVSCRAVNTYAITRFRIRSLASSLL